MYTILIYMYRLRLLFAKIPTTRDAKQRDANFKRLLKMLKILIKIILACSNQQNCFQLGTHFNMFGTKQNIVKKPKSITLTISVWQNQRQPQTYKFIS